MDIVALSHHSMNDRPSIYISLECDDGVEPVDMTVIYMTLTECGIKFKGYARNCHERRLECVCVCGGGAHIYIYTRT